MARRWNVGATVTAVAVAAAAATVLYAVDPSRTRLTPPCPYLSLTGLACPGCGLTRSMHALLHGNVAQAFSWNPWIFVAAPVAIVFGGLGRSADQARAARQRTVLAWIVLALTLLFWMWRNTAAYPFMRI